MATENADELVKLQIPVSADLAGRVACLAKRFDRSQNWLIAEVLHMAMEDRKSFANWVFDNLVGKMNRVVRALGSQPLHNPEIVRLQVSIPKALADEIEQLGERVGHSQVRMAGLLIEWLIDAHEIIMHGASSEAAKAFGRWLYKKPKQSCETAEGSDVNPDTSPASSCEKHFAAKVKVEPPKNRRRSTQTN